MIRFSYNPADSYLGVFELVNSVANLSRITNFARARKETNWPRGTVITFRAMPGDRVSVSIENFKLPHGTIREIQQAISAISFGRANLGSSTGWASSLRIFCLHSMKGVT